MKQVPAKSVLFTVACSQCTPEIVVKTKTLSLTVGKITLATTCSSMSPWALTVAVPWLQWYISYQITVSLCSLRMDNNQSVQQNGQKQIKTKRQWRKESNNRTYKFCHKAGGVCVLHRFRAGSVWYKKGRNTFLSSSTSHILPQKSNICMSTLCFILLVL